MKKFLFLVIVFPLIASSQEVLNEWQVVDIQDKFGDPTGKTYNRYFAEGTFSNSATSGSPLLVKISHLPDEAVLLGFHENKRSAFERFPENGKGVISIKRESGETYEFEGNSYSMGIYFEPKSPFYKLVTQEEDELLKIFVRTKDFNGSEFTHYLFEMRTQANK